MASDELEYAEATSGVAITGTGPGSRTTLLATPGREYDGATRVCVEVELAQIQTAPGELMEVALYQDAGKVNAVAYLSGLAQQRLSWRGFFTPPAGFHAFKVTAFTPGGGAYMMAGNRFTTGVGPSFLRVTQA